jgi:hypothetical protein
MKKVTSLPEEISAAVDRIAKKRIKGKGDPDELLYARLQVLTELEKAQAIRQAQREVVDALRETPDKNTWAKIAKSMGASLGAVWGRYGSSGSTTPESRKEQVAQYAERVTPDVGMSVTEAMRETGAYRATIYDHIERNPSAGWFARVDTSGKRGAVYRITDLDGLKKSLEGAGGGQEPLEGFTLAQAEQKAGIDRQAIRAFMAADPAAQWFTRLRPQGNSRAITRITDIGGLMSAAEKAARKQPFEAREN